MLQAPVILIGSLFATLSFAQFVNPGPKIRATIGEVWPKPYFQENSQNYFIIDPNNFNITAVGDSCDILEQAIERYKKIIVDSVNSFVYIPTSEWDPDTPQSLDSITVNLTNPCETLPHLEMDERYVLSTFDGIVADSIWGVLRALETFSQLVTPYLNGMLRVKEVLIQDEPRFPHRGLLVDTSRHFISMRVLYVILDGMECNKLNVFHWHIVDDQSFPYESKKFPELSAQGAYNIQMVYSQKDIADVIEYARVRGIRVIPEFDVPGHTRSWGVSHPELLTECQGQYKGKLGPMNPIKNSTYKFVNDFFSEVQDVFPEKFVHLGGDEVNFECWNSNDEIRKYFKKNRLDDYKSLQMIFMEKVTKVVTSFERIPIVWQEAMMGNVKMPPGTIVQVWLGNWQDLFSKFTLLGQRVLMSECWYLDHVGSGGDWVKYYKCEPNDFYGTDAQKKLVIGGEACMWSEAVNDRNILPRIFPRVSAAAERLWSPRQTTDVFMATRRMEEHVCRMNLRGIDAQPADGPGFC